MRELVKMWQRIDMCHSLKVVVTLDFVVSAVRQTTTITPIVTGNKVRKAPGAGWSLSSFLINLLFNMNADRKQIKT